MALEILQEGMGENIIENPFRVPEELDRNLLELRNEEQQRRKTEKLIQRRSTKQCSHAKLKRSNERTNDFVASKSLNSQIVGFTSSKRSSRGDEKRNASLEMLFKENDILSRSTPDSRMSVKEFVSKKREVLLLNVKIETLYENIDKLHRQINERENSLQAKKVSLAESITRFDEFLKETDEKAQNAQRQVEKETAKRIKLQKEVDALNEQIERVKAQISNHNDTLEEFFRCKHFIDLLTPPSWLDEKIAEKRQRQRERRRGRIKARQESYQKEQQLLELKRVGAEENMLPVSRGRVRKTTVRKQTILEENMPPPDFEDEPLTSSDEDIPMYFESPGQLQDQFNKLENENDTLLKIIEERENTLRDLQIQRDDPTNNHEPKTDDEDSKHVSREELENNRPLQLETKIKKIYEKCGLGIVTVGSSSDTRKMLSGLETHVKTLVAKVEDIPRDWLGNKLNCMENS